MPQSLRSVVNPRYRGWLTFRWAGESVVTLIFCDRISRRVWWAPVISLIFCDRITFLLFFFSPFFGSKLDFGEGVSAAMPALTSAERAALQRAVSVHGRAWDVIAASGACPGRGAPALRRGLEAGTRSARMVWLQLLGLLLSLAGIL